MTDLYPLRFEPIYQYRLWGGRRLNHLIFKPLPDGPVGEAWLLSDREDHQSLVADGPLKGQSIGQLMERFPEQLLGSQAQRFRQFPLLLKFLDVHEMLSVQVHPSDAHRDLLPEGETGKTEAWVVLETEEKSRIYAGLKVGTTKKDLLQALDNGSVADCLSSFVPKPGDGIFLPAGTVHALGGDVMVFEVQQNSDVTFRLYDWDHIDEKTGKTRHLQIDEALACINFNQVAVGPVIVKPESILPIMRERLFDSTYFRLWRLQGESPFTFGEAAKPRVLVCVAGTGKLEYEGVQYSVGRGDVFIIPAIVGACDFRPSVAVSLYEIALPETKSEVKGR